MILSQKRVAPDAFHHLAAKRREVLAEFRRPLRHAIELFLLQKHFLVHINFNNKFDTEMALTHNLFVNVDEFANMGPSQQGRPWNSWIARESEPTRDLPIISVQKWRKHAEKYVENLYKKGLVAAKRVVWCSVSVVSTPTLHTTKLINNQQFKYHGV